MRMKFVDTFKKHQREPYKSADAYAKEKRLELGAGLLATKKIYLDTKYWLLLRDAKLGRARDEYQVQMLALTERVSSSGRYIFPICEDIFVEVLKQTDPDTLRSTVALIDSFSKGVSLLSGEERVRLEVFHFLETCLGSSVFCLQELVWTKVAYNLGYLTPYHDKFPKHTNTLIQKAFFDQMWSASLMDIVETISRNGAPNLPPIRGYSERLNTGKFAHMHQNNTFNEMFLSEIAGMVDSYKADFKDLFAYKFEKQYGCPPNPEDLELSESGQLFANMIYNLFNLNKVKQELPSFRIHAGLHAAVRWDKKQKYQDNDMHDFRHATAALGYCDYFFTEKRLCHLVTQDLLKYDKLFNCKTLWRVDDAVECLTTLAS
jgi:hypothetical protein